MKTKHKKRMSRRRSAAMKNKSTNYNEGELNFSNVIDENHPKNQVLQSLIDYVDGHVDDLPEILNGFSFKEEPVYSTVFTKTVSYARQFDSLAFRHADGSYVRICSYKECELFISHVEVVDGRRDQGLGTELMIFILETVHKACGFMPKISLDITRGGFDFRSVDTPLHKIRMKFFRKFGFRLNRILSRYPSYNLMELDWGKFDTNKLRSELYRTTPEESKSENNTLGGSKLKFFEKTDTDSLLAVMAEHTGNPKKLMNLLSAYGVSENTMINVIYQKDNALFLSMKEAITKFSDEISCFDQVESVINQAAVNSVASNYDCITLQFRNVIHFSFSNSCQLRFTTFQNIIEITKIEVPEDIRLQGNGTKLMNMLFEIAKLAGINSPGIAVYLVDEYEREGLVKFFKKFGFEPQVKVVNGALMLVVNHQFELGDFQIECEIINNK
jgi:GNAT superfamily N-acetyltransferase